MTDAAVPWSNVPFDRLLQQLRLVGQQHNWSAQGIYFKPVGLCLFVPWGIGVASLRAHRKEGMLWFEHESEGGSKVMVLPWGLEMVCHRQIMHCPAHSPHGKS